MTRWRYSLRWYSEVIGTPPVGSGSWQLVREDGLFAGEWLTWPEAVAEVFPSRGRHQCPRCRSWKWVSVSLDGGYSRRAQCVPCGAYGDRL